MFDFSVSILQSLCNQLEKKKCLLHSSAEHLICSDEHDADDKCDGEGTNQAFTHTRVFFLLCWARCGKIYNKILARLRHRAIKKDARAMWEIKSASLPRTVNVHVGLWTVQVVLLSHDDVLDIFHGEVVTERIVKQSLQLIHSQFLHVTLGRQKTQTKV